MIRGIIILSVIGLMFGCHKIRSLIVDMTGPSSIAADSAWQPKVVFDGPDVERKKIKVGLQKITDGFKLPTDMQFVPGEPALALIAQKEGELAWLDVNTTKQGTLLKLPVETPSEQGLLGIAFHPNFQKNRKVYLNYVVKDGGKNVTRLGEFIWRKEGMLSPNAFNSERVILNVEQPYSNHNAGQIVFGPDGFLYLGFGDGGWADDPHEHGQNPKTLLGTMLRIDVDRKENGKEYGIPKDNPFVGRNDFLPEIWAYGLRNPWRYSFDRKGNLIVADVGQNKWEEISIVEKGGNYGWNIMEADQCFKPKACNKSGLKLPMVVYGREDGVSITGGYVYYGEVIKDLKGKYIFADYGSQRVWAVDAPTPENKNGASKALTALGNWGMSIATFGQDASGEIYALDFFRGGIYKLTSS